MTFGASTTINTTVNSGSIGTTLQTSIAQDGVTFTFDTAMPVGRFVTGEPFVVATQGFQVTSITPASGNLNGDGFDGNGAMMNPWILSGDPQGFDGYLGTGNSSANITYDAAANVDPGVSGPLAIAGGARASVVKSIRRTGTGTGGQWQTIQKYVVLTVLDVAPPEGAYRPGVSGTTKPIRTRGQISFSPRGLPMPANFPSVAAILDEVPPFLPMFITNGERRRRLRLDASFNTANSNYSADLVAHYARFIYALNTVSTTAAQRQEIIDGIMTNAGDLETALEMAAMGTERLGAGAGQGGGMWLWGMAAAALTRDESLLQAVHAARLQPTANGFWVDVGNIGSAANGKSGVEAQTYVAEHLGIPHLEPDEPGSHHGARYLNLAADITGWEQAAICSFAQGPAGKASGQAMILDGASANDPGQPLTASHAFLSRWYRFSPPVKPTGGTSLAWRQAWDDLIAAGAATPWSGIPDQPPKGNSTITDANGYFSTGASAGTIAFDDRNINYTTAPITRTDIRYSLDGVQWIELNDVTLIAGRFTLNGLLRGRGHYVGWRRHSASGPSPWSANFPYATGDGPSEVITTSGSASAAAPVNTVTPAISYRPHPGWEHPYWLPSPTTVGGNDVELAAGVGYWSGAPAPSFAFQWRRDGVAISGATEQTYTRAAQDADAVLTCDITASNASGAQTVTTGGVTCPPLTVLPATTLVDTEFRGRFAIDYETEIAGIVTDDANARHEPTQSLDGLTGLNFGALRCDKTGSRPSLDLPLQNSAVAGASYAVTAQVATSSQAGSKNGFTGNLEFSIRNGSGTVFFSDTLTPASATKVELKDITGSFTVPGGESDLVLYARIRNSAPEGGSGRGDPMLHRLVVSES